MLRTSKALYWGQKYHNTFEVEEEDLRRGEYVRGHSVSALEQNFQCRMEPGEHSDPLLMLKPKGLVCNASEDKIDTKGSKALELSIDDAVFATMDKVLESSNGMVDVPES